jgi:hypothetical protein
MPARRDLVAAVDIGAEVGAADRRPGPHPGQRRGAVGELLLADHAVAQRAGAEITVGQVPAAEYHVAIGGHARHVAIGEGRPASVFEPALIISMPASAVVATAPPSPTTATPSRSLIRSPSAQRLASGLGYRSAKGSDGCEFRVLRDELTKKIGTVS